MIDDLPNNSSLFNIRQSNSGVSGNAKIVNYFNLKGKHNKSRWKVCSKLKIGRFIQVLSHRFELVHSTAIILIDYNIDLHGYLGVSYSHDMHSH